ncbi:MAG: hypothetical protein LBQ80_01365 [Clostridium sp.]|jgi:hypothetical protein|nr:hypothetical protein [Clostridium sp.]
MLFEKLSKLLPDFFELPEERLPEDSRPLKGLLILGILLLLLTILLLLGAAAFVLYSFFSLEV